MEEIELSSQNQICLEVIENRITDLNGLVLLPEFKMAWEAEFASRINHNYHNRSENKQAEDLVIGLLKCQDLYNPLVPSGLSALAKENKSRDFKWSLFSDFLRTSFAIGMILIDEYYKEDEAEIIRPILKYTPIVTQLSLMLKTSFNGYQAAITRHLSEELTNSFCKVVDDFTSQFIKQKHDLNFPDSTTRIKDNHHQSFASLPRNLGTILNLISMSSNLPRLAIEYFPKLIPELKFNQSAGSYFAIIGAGVSSLGKFSSSYAANSNLEIVKTKMDKAKEDFDLKKIALSESEARNILNNLTSIYRDDTKDPSFSLKYLKLPFNFTKDSFYGASYKIYNWLINFRSSELLVVGSARQNSLSHSTADESSPTINLALISQDLVFDTNQASSSNFNFQNPLEYFGQEIKQSDSKEQKAPAVTLKPINASVVLSEKSAKLNQIP